MPSNDSPPSTFFENVWAPTCIVIFSGFSRAQRDAIKSRQRTRGKLHPFRTPLRRIQVDLRHFVAADVAGVLDVDGNVETLSDPRVT